MTSTSQRWLIYGVALCAIALYFVPPWRLFIEQEVVSSPYTSSLWGYDRYVHGVRSEQPVYRRSFERTGESGRAEHVEEYIGDAHIDQLRLGLEFAALAVVAAIGWWRTRRGQPPASWWIRLVVIGCLAWLLADQVMLRVRPRVETWLLDRQELPVHR